MRITLMQMDTVWADPAANTSLIERLIGDNPGSDLYVLPEMFSTGFITCPGTDAEPWPSPSFGKMLEWAERWNCAIAGSIAADVNGRRLNRFCFVKPGGQYSIYDKRHLFTYGGEHERFSAGKERVTVEWRGVRFLPLVCYDLRFPVWARNRGDYDAIICVANWPGVRAYAWDTLLRARAIENQAFVIGVNRAGEDRTGLYRGGSALIDPLGKPLAVCRDFAQDTVSAELDMDMLTELRGSFPVLGDADPFSM